LVEREEANAFEIVVPVIERPVPTVRKAEDAAD